MDLHAARLQLHPARQRVPATRPPPTSAAQGQPRPQQLGVGVGVGDRNRCLPPRPRPPPSRGETGGSGGVGKAGEVRGTRDTCRGVSTRDAAPVSAGDSASGPAVARDGKGKGVAGLDSAEDKGHGDGDAGRKRGLGSAAAYPPPKRRPVSAARLFPPGTVSGRDAAADDADGASDARKKTVPSLSVANAGSSVMQVESSAAVVSAPVADSGHRGIEAELQSSSEPSCRSGVPSANGLLDTDSQGCAGFLRKELVPATRRLLPKPRMVSAVRRFPPGCGRARASLVAGGGSTEVRLPSPEKVVTTDGPTLAADRHAMQIPAVPCNAITTDRAAHKEQFVEGEIGAPKVQPEGSQRSTHAHEEQFVEGEVGAPKIQNQGSQRSTDVTLHESAACRDRPSVPAISLPCKEKRPSCVVAKDIKVVTKSAGSSSSALAQSLAQGASKEHVFSAKMDRAISGVAPGTSGQGSMKRDKVMSTPRKEVSPAKLIQKSAPDSQPSPFSKIKKKETEHGRRGSEDTAGFAKHQDVQASTSGNKCLRTDREAAPTIGSSFDPKKKGTVKQKSMVPSDVEDDILKALAAREEKYAVQNVDVRRKVKMMCMRFEFILRAVTQAVKRHSFKVPRNRIDLAAGELIKKTPGFTQHEPTIGNVPGIEVGDEFVYRVELNIVGLHRPYQGGIDTTRDKQNMLIAISVVASGGYPDQLSRSGELVYTGSGGKISGKGEGDQKLEKGNLALKNCIRTKTPVRVIHRFKGLNREESNHSRAKEISMFTYDGLYNVVECWREGQPGSKVFKYKLQRIPGQAELNSHRKKAGITG